MVRLSCGVQARTDALLFRTDCTRLPDRTALGSTTAELGRRVLRRKANGLHLHTFAGCMLSSLCCELTALWACEKVTPAVAVLLLAISLLTLCLAAPVNDVNIHFDSDEMQALRGGMQKRLAVYAAVSGTVFLRARRYLVSFPHPLVSLPCACFWHGWGLESP